MNKNLFVLPHIKLLVIFSMICYSIISQTRIKSENYFEMEPGIYGTKSLDTAYNHLSLPTILPQKKFNKQKNIAFLNAKNENITVFDSWKKDTQKPVGYISESSIIEVDTIFYNQIYKNPKKEYWELTFDVWYAININNKKYYTDLKIHDFIAYQEELKNFDQKFILVAQNTGYDDLYDIGYPEYYFVVILNSENEMIYKSDILDFKYGDEFWESDFNVKTEIDKDNNFSFTIVGFDHSYTAIWDGKQLIKQQN